MRIGFFGHVILNISWKGSPEDTWHCIIINTVNVVLVGIVTENLTIDNSYPEEFVVTVTVALDPAWQEAANKVMLYYRMCGCYPWSKTISHVSS